jgi:hypothetical protein
MILQHNFMLANQFIRMCVLVLTDVLKEFGKWLLVGVRDRLYGVQVFLAVVVDAEGSCFVVGEDLAVGRPVFQLILRDGLLMLDPAELRLLLCHF